MKSKLTDTDKKSIVKKYLAGITQANLAREYSVHRKTIQKALYESGVNKEFRHVTNEEYDLLDLLRTYNMNMRKLRHIFSVTGLHVKNPK